MLPRIVALLAAGVLSLVALPSADAGAPYDPVDTLLPAGLPSCTEVGAWEGACAAFGADVATDGTLFVIGAPRQPYTVGASTYFDAGAVYVATEDVDGAWVMNPLHGSDTDGQDRFGARVDVDAGRILATASWKPQAYIFEPDGTGWMETILTPDDPQGVIYLGRDGAISGDRAVVLGYDDTLGSGSRVDLAVVFEQVGGAWVEVTKIFGSVDSYWTSVDIDGDRIVIGDRGTNAAHVYTWNGAAWDHSPLVAPATGNEIFGFAVAIDGTTAFVSDVARNQGTLELAGAVYAYTLNGDSWDRIEVEPPEGHVAYAQFGYAIHATDGTLLVGAQSDNTADVRGAAYLLRSDAGWSGEALPETGLTAGYWGCESFGTSVGAGGGGVIVGASDVCSNDAFWQGHGAANIYRSCAGRPATLVGTPSGEIIHGTSGGDVIFGGTGSDTLWGYSGDDVVCGGPGHDTIDGGPGHDTLLGGTWNDTIDGRAGRDVLEGGPGDDTLTGGTWPDKLYGDAGDDTLNGGDGPDVAWGGVGNDVISGGPGGDKLYGEAGIDTIGGGGGPDVLAGGSWGDVLSGHGGDDTIYGGYGADQAWGGDDHDWIEGGPGNDKLYGEAGRDLLAGQGDDDLLGGGSWPDRLFGGYGDDKLYGGGGEDENNGGQGTDACSVEPVLVACESPL